MKLTIGVVLSTFVLGMLGGIAYMYIAQAIYVLAGVLTNNASPRYLIVPNRAMPVVLWLLWTYWGLSWCAFIIAAITPWLRMPIDQSWLLWIVAFVVAAHAPVNLAQNWFNATKRYPDDLKIQSGMVVAVSAWPAVIVGFVVFALLPHAILTLWAWVPYSHNVVRHWVNIGGNHMRFV